MSAVKTLGLCLILVIIGGCTSIPSSHPETISESIVVPLERIAKSLVIPVTIDGVDLKLAVDSGAGGIALFENENNEEFFLKADSRRKIRGVKKKVKSIEKAVLQFKNLPPKDVGIVLIPKKMNPVFPWNQSRIDGIIGFDLFSNYDVLIDQKNNNVTIMGPGKFQYDAQPIDIKIRNGVPYVMAQVEFDGANAPIETEILIDTGSSVPMIVRGGENLFHRLEKTSSDELYIQTIASKKSYFAIGRSHVILDNADLRIETYMYPEPVSKMFVSLGITAFPRQSLVFSYDTQKLYIIE